MKQTVRKIFVSCTLFACVAAVSVFATPAAAESSAMMIGESGQGWRYNSGGEFKGAEGSLSHKFEDGRAINVLKYDLSNGGRYVGAVAATDIPHGFSELRVQVRSDKVCQVFFRLRDASGQYHQVRLPYTEAGQWQTLRLNLNNLRTESRWGGKNDGKLYFPITQVWFCAGSPKEPVGAVEFTDMKVIE